MALQHLRSGTAHKRPIPTVMSAGQIAINTNEASPGLFFRDSNGDLVKTGPVHIGTTAPNSSPASTDATALVSGTVYQILTVGTTDFTTVGAADNEIGTIFTATGAATGDGTVSGQQGVEKGEQWLDTSNSAYVLKVYDGTAWRDQSTTYLPLTGGTMTGALLLDNAASAAAPDLSFDSDADTGIYSPGADQFGIATGGTSRVVVDANGEVGIGTASPGQTVDIAGQTPTARFAASGQTVGRIFLESDRDAANALLGRITGQWNDTDVASILFRTGSDTVNKDDGQITFGTASEGTVTERVRIDGEGNVGIGVTDAGQRLVVGSASNTVIRIDNADDSTAKLYFHNSGSTDMDISVTGGEMSFTSGGSNERMRIDSSGRLLIAGSTSMNSASTLQVLRTNGNGIITIGRDDSSVSAGNGIGAIDFHGNAGGTYQQCARILAIAEATHALGDKATGLAFYTNSGGASATERLRIDESGNVGIGTTSPGEKLAVSGSGDVKLEVETTSNSNASLRLKTTDSEFLIQGGNAAGDGLRFYDGSNSTERMRIDSSGNVGIGTTSPEEILHVAAASELVNSRDGVMFQSTSSLAADTGLPLVFTSHIGTQTNYGVASIAGRKENATSGNAAGYLQFATGNSAGSVSERMRIDSSGRLLVGTSSSVATGFNVGANIQIFGDTGSFAVRRGAANEFGPTIALGKTRSTTDGSFTIVQNNDSLGAIRFTGDDGADFQTQGAKIEAFVDGTPSSNDMPGRLVFSTTSDGSSSPTERMRIDSSGRLLYGHSSAKTNIQSVSDTFGDPRHQLFGTGQFTAHLSVNRFTTVAAGAAYFSLTRSNTNTLGGNARVDAGDRLGQINFQGNDGTNYIAAASIVTEVDQTPGTNDMPGRLIFSTTANGADAPTERMRISSNGTVSIGNDTAETNVSLLVGGSNDAVHKFKVYGSDTTSAPFIGMGYDGSAGVLTAGHSGSGSCPLVFRVASAGTENEVARFTTDENLLINASSAFAAEVGAHLQIQGNASGRTPAIALMRNDTTVTSGNSLAQIHAYSDDGNVPENCGSLRFTSTQTHTATARGAYASIFTTKSNTVGSVERFRVDHNGLLRSFGDGTAAAVFRTTRTSNTENAISIVKGASSVAATGTTVFTVKAGDGDVENINGRISAISDVKLKENIVDANSQWDDIKAVRMRNYNFKAETGYETTTMLGVVAQEIEQVSPGLVKTSPDLDEDGNDLGTTTKSVAYSLLYMKSVKALQEAMARIESLEAKVAALEAGN